MQGISSTTLIGLAVVLAIIGGLFAALAANKQQQELLSITNFDECAAAGYPIMPARTTDSVQSGGESYPERCATPDGRSFINEKQSMGTTTEQIVLNGCAVAGCSKQLCVSTDEARNVMTTCEYKAEYACYKKASCEPQADGKCGWTQTNELKSCLKNPPHLEDGAEAVY